MSSVSVLSILYLCEFILDYGPALTEHCLQSIGLPENVKIGKGFIITEG